MEDINGKKIYSLRKTQEKILTAWKENKSKKVSIRDEVRAGDIAKVYILWNTLLVFEKLDGSETRIRITGNDDMSDEFYRYGRQKDVIMTNTTKNRLNTFLLYYGFDTLEVHSSKKEWCVKYRGKELELESWYLLDFETKELVKY